jgi:hypothetical protein
MRDSRKGKGGYPILQGNPESANCCRTLTLTPHTKGRLTSLRFSEVIDGLELVQFFVCLITDRA